MGCLNANRGFTHWFGNIHLSGPCNRSCYFCIGQHMMALDSLNNLNEWPLRNLREFELQCAEKGVRAINLTGTNTDPLLYQHIPRLISHFKRISAPNPVKVGIRSNGVAALAKMDEWNLFDFGSLTFASFDPAVYRKCMGGEVIDIGAILQRSKFKPKVNIVLSPFIPMQDLNATLYRLQRELGIVEINLREPYGQPHVGDPMPKLGFVRTETTHGMPTYGFSWNGGSRVTYWDVHYVEVESVNLYANGRVSVTYPITKGHADSGEVHPQSEFGTEHKRHREQWQPVTFKEI